MSVQFKDNSAAVKAQLEKNIEKALVSMGLHWQRRATELATENEVVDTGRYRASLSYITPAHESGTNKQASSSSASQNNDVLRGRAPDKTVIVGSNVNYAPYIEEGARGRPARRVVGNAILYYKDEYEEIAAKILGEGFGVTTSL
ncbi:MAG: hypothetical protein FWD23_16110 [Oscillospiraceae bacterium]|nr:hypothetical protein [Oscillospiraceae bacterium]